MPDQIEDTIRKYALQNAVFFKGKAKGRSSGDAPSSGPRRPR